MRDIFKSASFNDDVENSFDFSKNLEAICKAGEMGGGASGELFFMTHDKQCMFKTISESEAKVFRAMIVEYSKHMSSNEKTLIGRIYG